MSKFIVKLMDRLIASTYYLRELEKLALDWLADQFTGRASDQWEIVIREAARTATTSGIGPNSVLYRALRDMLLAYPAHGVKAAIMRRKVSDLVWAPNKTTVEIHSIVMEYYEAYDRAVAQTHGMADVTMILPAQRWASLTATATESSTSIRRILTSIALPASLPSVASRAAGAAETPIICATTASIRLPQLSSRGSAAEGACLHLRDGEGYARAR